MAIIDESGYVYDMKLFLSNIRHSEGETAYD